MENHVISFIGCGNMAQALLGGLIADGYPAVNLRAADPDENQLRRLKQKYGVSGFTNNEEAIADADVVVLAIKPQMVKSVLASMAPSLGKKSNQLIISIAAGIRTQDLLGWLAKPTATVIRAMPNTPALVQSGATALYAGTSVSDEQREVAEAIMRAAGVTLWLQEEKLMDTVTAVSGSGPAYYFLMMELMEKSAMKMGLDAQQARLLSIQTAFGAAKMALESSLDPATLRVQVTSPGGTTETALKVLQAGGMDKLVDKALRAAQARSGDLAESFGES